MTVEDKDNAVARSRSNVGLGAGTGINMKYKIVRKCVANKYKEEVFFVTHPEDWRECARMADRGIKLRGWKDSECLWQQVSEVPNVKLRGAALLRRPARTPG